MSYVLNSDVEQRLGTSVYIQLTDDSGSGVADAGVVDEARLGAEAEVNSYLGRRYAVPVDVTDRAELAALLKSVTLDLVEFRLNSRRPPVPGVVGQKHGLALRWLERVAGGEVVLPVREAVGGNPANGVSGEVGGCDRVMSRDSMAGL